MIIQEIPTRSILTRTGGYLSAVCSHSLQPYRGCALGRSLCGVGCYAQHQRFLSQGRRWGDFLDVKTGVDRLYLESYAREKTWARRTQGDFGVFLSSSTEPFPPQERRLGVTRAVLEAMQSAPPDRLIVQTHSPIVTESLDLLKVLNGKCELRVHVSIESDMDRLPGLPGPFASVKSRIVAVRQIRDAGIRVVITVSPLLPMRDPDAFFRRLAEVADAVVIDHFIEGDGSIGGQRTLRTVLPAAMSEIDPASVSIDYRQEIIAIAVRHFPGRVGVGPTGFAGIYANGTPPPSQSKRIRND